MTWRYVEARDLDAPLLLRLLSFWRHRRLLRRMAERDLRQRYVGSMLGFAWAAIYPLLFIAVYAFIFTFVFRARFSADSPPTQYALYVISGLLPWVAFSEVATRATQTMAEHRNLVKYVVFPVQILPLTSLYATSFSQGIGLLALLALTLVLRGGVEWSLLLLLPVIALQAGFLAGVAWLLGAVGAILRDVKEVVTVLLMVGMFLTPIFYVEEGLPLPIHAIVQLNPMTHLVRLYRDAFFGSALHGPSLLVFGAVAVVILITGFLAFERTRAFLGDLL